MLNLKKLLIKMLGRVGSEMTYTTALNGITGGLRLWKDHSTGTVRCYGYFRRATNISDGTVIFTVPSGFRPPSNYEVPMFLYSSTGVNAGYYGTLHTNGNMYQNLGATIREGYVSAEWTCEE